MHRHTLLSCFGGGGRVSLNFQALDSLGQPDMVKYQRECAFNLPLCEGGKIVDPKPVHVTPKLCRAHARPESNSQSKL